ncbi:MAG: ABC transporter ATP-binding protein [Candidatus Dormibacteraeota bacterium]|nr:ABC transporter ATP-binding protein [Candidatus Dormibacteraeota bacterium]MBO0705030.1 ABC transporter ATP-binding protein [Candidatus Dormibacteraeota bacterium]MBO0759970.1 ABC transporter ATP-binding protein [Candidatus Dormibacteraeota bacterium]
MPVATVHSPATPVVLEGAHKSYGSVEALKGVDISIAEGEVVAILGPNGAGKTTAINLMLGLRKPTRGRARLFGLDPGDRRARSRCGVMLQESGVLSSLHVRELVGQFRSYYPNSMPVDRAIAMAGLEAEADRQSAKLSGGQRQRLYYALAVCGDPDLLFLDEPTVGMDVESRRAFLAEIRSFAAVGRTVVLTTHYLEEADELAQRVIVIDRGSVIADGSPGEIKARVGGRRITFDCPDGLREGDLAGLPVQSLDVRGTRAWMLSDEPEEVLRALFARGVAIQDLEVVGADLEEAFVSLTSHAEPAGSPPGQKVTQEVGS